MNGREHFAEAEQAIAASTYSYQHWGQEGDDDLLRAATWEMQRAHVHATLALAKMATGENETPPEPSILATMSRVLQDVRDELARLQP